MKSLLGKLKHQNTSVPNPGKVGVPSVKIPKIKSLPDATDKPSVFFKSEFGNVKHPTLCKLRDFMEKKHRKP